jgi:hypothetical protein
MTLIKAIYPKRSIILQKKERKDRDTHVHNKILTSFSKNLNN